MSEEKKDRCGYCGSDLGANALYCRKCLVPIAQPPRRRRLGTIPVFLGVFLIFGSPCAWVIGGQLRSQLMKASISQTTVHAASIATAPVVDQAEALIRDCGIPDSDESTANNDPRPPIPFRVLTYGTQHLEFGFVPGGGAKIGDPPPYHWSLSGVLDSDTNQRISLQDAAVRMGCAASLETSSNAALYPSPAGDSQPAAGPEESSIPDPQ